MTLRFVPAAVVVSVLAIHATPAPAQPRPLTADTLWEMKRVGLPDVSPDGRRIAVSVTTYDVQENKGNADIYLLDDGAAEARQLTTSDASDTSPSWSPDGRRIAFVSARAGGPPQLYVIDASGGEAKAVTKLPVGVDEPRWFPDGQRLAFLADVPADFDGDFTKLKERLDERAKSKVTGRATENAQYRYWDRWLTDGDVPRLFAVDVETGAVTELMKGSRRYLNFDGAEYSISPDGREVAVSANVTDPPYKTLNLDILLVPVDGSGPARSITEQNAASDIHPVYSPDGRYIVYGERRRRDFYADRVRLVRYDRQTRARVVLTETVDLSAQEWVFSQDSRTLYFHAESKAGKPVYAMSIDGGAVREVYRGGTNDGVTVAGDRLVVQHQTFTQPPEIYEVRADGTGFRKRSSFNDRILERVRFGKVENVTFTGAGGADVQMFVVYPPDFDPSRKWPLLQMIHGGPHSTFPDMFHFRWNAQLFAAAGYVVAVPNFHGSTSFGQAFAVSIHGQWPEKPFQDVMAATDHLIARGFVDERRMAAAGGSYGGYLVSWIAGHTTRFAALVNHAGVSDFVTMWGTDGTDGWAEMAGGSPWERPDVMARWNPITYAGSFRTPMLILHGERDYRVPIGQGLTIYGVYKARGLDARLVYFPDENHWVLKPQNSIYWNKEVRDWLDRYLSPRSGVTAPR
jgi:dipeptidyl aminopeptidase/acylaminoacyl peptidase